jgi:EmrB/QacA subfamily drug resistance transporter
MSRPDEEETETVTADHPLPAQGDDRSRWAALIVLCVGMLMIVLDATVVNVALPSIQQELGFSQSGLAWVVNAYLIAFGGLLLLAGRLGDLISRRAVFLAGLAVFTVASLLCGVAPSQETLVVARFVQGVGGAMTSAVILGMIVTMFPEPREQARAIGVFAFVASAGGSIGLFLGGVLTEAINWHWIFFVNLPIGIGTAAFAMRVLDKDRGIGLGRGADVPGAVLITAALMLGVYTIVGPAADDGWGAATTLALGGTSLALLAAFVAREARASSPLIPLGIFRSRNLSGANLVQALTVAGMFGQGFLGALYLQRVLGYDALDIGLAFLPLTVVMGVLSLRYSERLLTTLGARSALVAGLALMAAGLALFGRVDVDSTYVSGVLPTMLLLGAGAGVSAAAVMTLAMSGVAGSEAGVASGLINTTSQVGGALGLAVLATVATTRTRDVLADGGSAAGALTDGYRLAFLIAAGLLVAAIAIALTVVQPARSPSQHLEPAYGEA